MKYIVIPDFYFDSLVDWSDINSIREIYPEIDSYHASLAKEFRRCTIPRRKLSLMYNLIDSIWLSSNKDLSVEQTLFLTELIHSEFDSKLSLIDAINEFAEVETRDWRIFFEGDRR